MPRSGSEASHSRSKPAGLFQQPASEPAIDGAASLIPLRDLQKPVACFRYGTFRPQDAAGERTGMY